jgi:organic radical activating enzyme
MDWKLPGSGESYQDANRFENFKRLDGQDAIKFTIADRNDYDHAISIWDALRASNSRRIDEVPEIFYGPVWGKIEASELIKWALEDNRQWRLNLQTHNLIWDRTKRGI